MPKYDVFIEKLTSFFDVREKIKESFDLAEKAFIKPFITIAREPGSGGAPIAKAIADKLGYEYIDEQIIDQIAKSTKKRKAIIAAVDEKSRTKIEDIIHSTLNTEYISDTTYVYELVKVLVAHAYQGKTVILGRGANFVTPFAKGLHINVVAPYKIRVQRAMDFEGHSISKAKEVIADIEKERKDFVKQYFKRNINDPYYYDMILNTAYLRVPEARDIIIEAFRRKFSHSLRTR